MQRLWFQLERKFGRLEKRTPCSAWAKQALQPTEKSAELWRKKTPALPIAIIPRDSLAPFCEQYAIQVGYSPVAEARGLTEGRLRIFNHRVVNLGFPFNWQRNVLSGRLLEHTAHWAKISDAAQDDIKGVWEASRFSWVFPLVRAWIIEGTDIYPETFWKLFEDWMEKNPPNQGPQWMCGQEASMRLIAVAYALQAFRNHASSTNQRIVLTTQLAEATAARINGHLAYAISQSNNHGISEAIGLFTAGALWPNSISSAQWRSDGLEKLLPQIEKLVSQQGAFSQHSTNYHRLFLHLMIWVEVVLRAEHQTLPETAQKKIRAAILFITDLIESDGTVARYGADDGAYLFPLSSSSHEDFRPVINTAQALFMGCRLPEGPWDEEALLLIGPLAVSAAELPQRETIDRPQAGVAVLRHPRGSVFLRAPTEFKFRPSHADQLHVSIRWDNQWLAEDMGTFSYNSPLVGADGAQTFQHNTVTINNHNSMQKFGRFLWLPWIVCQRIKQSNGIKARYTDFQKYTHERTVQRTRQGFLIIDRIQGTRPGKIAIHWHGRSKEALEELAIICSGESNETWSSGNEKTGQGWYSVSYGSREPAWTRTIFTQARQTTFVTAIGCEIKLDKNILTIDGKESKF